MTLKIDSDIPVPTDRPSPGPSMETLAVLSLGVGQSVFIPNVSLTRAANFLRRGKALKCTYATRTVTEGEAVGVRIWRVS